ncbi:MAG TPA: M13 family metallopeptidase [Flavisolibacter sp.]
MRIIVIPLALAIIAAGCNDTVKSSASNNDILFTNLDSTVDPSQDFFMYANGGWIRQNPIPGDQSSWTIGHAVQEELYKRLRSINEQSLNAKEGVDKKVGDFWYSAMDTATMEQEKLKPVQTELDQVNSITDIPSLVNVVADFHKKGIGGFFGEYVTQDDKNSELMSLYMVQGGLGMPNRDYYFKTDARTTGVRDAYRQYATRVFSMLGANAADAEQKAKAHLELETQLASASRKLEALRDPYANYNKMAIADLKSLSPSIDWASLLAKQEVKNIDSVVIGQPEFYRELETVVKSTPIEVLKDYLRFNVIRFASPYLDKNTYASYFDFYGKSLRGIEKPKEHWKRMLDVQDGLMGEALGRVFVKEFFNETAKKRYSDLVEEVKTSLKEHIQNLDWMSAETKEKAYVKLASIKKKVGYPDKWKDFSAMQIDRGPLVRNVINARLWWHQYEVNKLGKPVDRDEWVMNPQTYNAYYNPSNNEIVLPAGIFTVPGMRDEELDDALVYGYAGATTIGHEITHGFDDQGRQYDEKGNLKMWWTAKDSAEFAKRAQMMVKQFNEYVVVDSGRINGEATLGENIADLGGAVLALDAFKKTETFKKGELINGMTPLQRFFMGYALGWLGHERKESLASRLLTDVHSPAKWRVNGTFVNVDDFYKAFNIKEGSPMYRPDSLRVRIW